MKFEDVCNILCDFEIVRMSHGALGDSKSRVPWINLIEFDVFWIQLRNLHLSVLRDIVIYDRYVKPCVDSQFQSYAKPNVKQLYLTD